MRQRLPKFRRSPDAFRDRKITARSIDILQFVARYRLIPRSLLVRLVQGDMRTTDQHLQVLYHLGLLNRFAFPRLGANPGEFIYYADNLVVLELIAHLLSADEHEELAQSIRNNRYKDYAGAVLDADGFGKLMFVHHETMLSRFRATLELACRASGGAAELVSWQQGSKLFNSVEVSEPHERRLPHRPDAFFTLRRPNAPERDQLLHFFYEADRHTSNTERMKDKFQSHFWFTVKTRKHQEAYSVERIRAVLVETVDGVWAEQLREAAADPVVSGPKPSSLFWITSSEFFLKKVPAQDGSNKELPMHLARPGIILDQIWMTPADDQFRSLLD